MTQSVVAEDLDSYEDAMWFTSSYLISMASLAPLFGRLSTIFSPRNLVLPLGVCFAVGGVTTSQAQSFWAFIFGRVITGMGGAGIMTLSVIFVLELVSKKRRGVFIGLVNAGFTIGLSFGAVVYGALLPVIGWVRSPLSTFFLFFPSSFQESTWGLTRCAESSLRFPDASRRLCLFGRLLERPQDIQLRSQDQGHLGLSEAGSHRLRGRRYAGMSPPPQPLPRFVDRRG